VLTPSYTLNHIKMDRENLCTSLLTWMQTFNLPSSPSNVEDLRDGVAMAQALHQIAPHFFSDSWMSKIRSDVASNWRLKVSNLKKILQGILSYYSDVLGQHINDFHMPDVNIIGETGDPLEMGRLMQLILGCAVNCDDKQEYIQRIMALEEKVQHVVMNAIQELMTKEAPNPGTEGLPDVNDQLKKAQDEINNLNEAKEEISQRCHELDLQVANLQEERAVLKADNDCLMERISQADCLEDMSTPAGRRFHQLQNQVENLQDELYRLEAGRDDFRIKVELQEKEILDLQQKNEELSTLSEEARQLKDEMDIMKHTTDKVAKYEATIESYRKKFEELSDLKGQVKLLEVKNTAYMQTNLDLEEDVRKSSTVRSQMEVYKRQVQELQMKSTEETKRADKAEFETMRLTDKMSAIQREKDRLIIERDTLKETNEELTCTQVQNELLVDDSEVNLDGSANLDMLTIPPEVKERLIRLQHENKMLKLSRAECEDEQGKLTQDMLDDANARNSELQSELRIVNQRVLEMSAQVEDMTESERQSHESLDTEAAGLRRNYAELKERCSSLEQEVNRSNTQRDILEPKLTSSNNKLVSLQDQLSRKDEDMRSMEERYKRYLEKAKSVIRTLDPKLNPSSNEVMALRSQLQEKERLIEHLERDHEKAKGVREQEEKLIVTAWYNLGMQLHRKATEDRLQTSGAGQSFLARQRQAHTQRPQSSAQSPVSPHLRK